MADLQRPQNHPQRDRRCEVAVLQEVWAAMRLMGSFASLSRYPSVALPAGLRARSTESLAAAPAAKASGPQAQDRQREHRCDRQAGRPTGPSRMHSSIGAASAVGSSSSVTKTKRR